MNITDLKIYLSGGAGNTDPNASLGGARGEELEDKLHNLFRAVTGVEHAEGLTDYRGIYLVNTSAETAQDVAVAVLNENPDVVVKIATESKNTELQEIAPPATPPATFVHTTDIHNFIKIGNLAPNEYVGIWLERKVVDDSSPAPDAFVNLTVGMDI